jgi:hypothetical protein
MVTYILIAAALCAAWAVVTAVLLTMDLDRRGMPTPFPWIGALLFRNLFRYRAVTVREMGKVGTLYYSYVIPINAALVLAVIAFLLR